jgi:hypothetical protein
MRFPKAWDLAAPWRRPGALLPAAAALLLAVAACEEPQQPPPLDTINGPTDVAFTCYGRMRITDGTIVTTLLPMKLCQDWDKVTIDRNDNGTPDSSSDDYYTLGARPPDGQGPIDLPQAGERLNDAQIDALADWLGSIHLYGFVLQRNRGTVAITQDSLGSTQDIDPWDGDPFGPGINPIPVGAQPVGIVSDPTGCHMLTANAGSCDLSVLDMRQTLGGDEVPVVRSVAVRNAAGDILAVKPRAVVSQPGSLAEVPPGTELECTDSFGGLVYVAYPDCNAVAAVDAATGEVRGRVVFHEDGSVEAKADGNLSCGAATCGGPAEPPVVDRPDAGPVVVDAGIADAGAPDAAAPDAGPGIAAVDPRPRPAALYVAQDGKRLYVGTENRAQVTVVELGDDALPASAWSVPLEGDVGVTALAATELLAMGGASGYSDEGTLGDFRFVYAVATDNTVRVAEVHEQRRECDTQIDPRFLRDLRDPAEVPLLACLPIGDPALPRRAGATSPGIRMPGGARPLDVAFVSAPRLRPEEPDEPEYRPPALPATLIGTFAFVSVSTGAVVVVNVDDDNYADLEDTAVPVEADLSLALPHQIRDGGLDRRSSRHCKPVTPAATPDTDAGVPSAPSEYLQLTCTSEADDCSYEGLGTGGSPTVSTDPASTSATSATRYLSQSFFIEDTLPSLRGVECDVKEKKDDDPELPLVAVSELSRMAQDSLRESVFPDLRSVPPIENWNVVWEGVLTLQGAAESIRRGLVDAGAGLVLQDSGRPFCAMGAQPGDVVALLGCDPSLGAAECRDGEDCTTFNEVSGSGRIGICVPAERASDLGPLCERFRASQRRYLVQEAQAGRLVLAERKHVLRTTPVEGCTSAEQCTLLHDIARDMAANRELEAPTADGEPARSWVCEPDPLRDPGRNVCLMKCNPANQDSDCDTDLQCSDEGYCVEAVLPPDECVETLQQYQVRAGEAFTVTGAVTGFLHNIIADPDTADPAIPDSDACIANPDPLASPLAVGRVPLDVPPCVEGDGFTDVTPNPCATTLSHSHIVSRPKLDENGEQVVDENDNPVTEDTLVTRETSAIRFRNPVFATHLVDPVLDPAARGILCTMDGESCPEIPIVFPGYSLAFTITGGFVPLLAVEGTLYPVELVPDPLGAIWIMDQSGGQISKLEPLTLKLPSGLD